jgi:hypothetical protein
MAHLGWAGPGKMIELDLPRARTPEITEPTSPEPVGSVTKTKLHRCTVEGCNQRFKLQAISARHFNTTHAELKQDAESWRKFTEVIWE